MRYEEADTLSRVGDAERGTHNRDAASSAWMQALEILEELEHPDADTIRAKLKDLDQPSAKT
jgi:hypothetical protein